MKNKVRTMFSLLVTMLLISWFTMTGSVAYAMPNPNNTDGTGELIVADSDSTPKPSSTPTVPLPTPSKPNGFSIEDTILDEAGEPVEVVEAGHTYTLRSNITMNYGQNSATNVRVRLNDFVLNHGENGITIIDNVYMPYIIIFSEEMVTTSCKIKVDFADETYREGKIIYVPDSATLILENGERIALPDDEFAPETAPKPGTLIGFDGTTGEMPTDTTCTVELQFTVELNAVAPQTPSLTSSEPNRETYGTSDRPSTSSPSSQDIVDEARSAFTMATAAINAEAYGNFRRNTNYKISTLENLTRLLSLVCVIMCAVTFSLIIFNNENSKRIKNQATRIAQLESHLKQLENLLVKQDETEVHVMPELNHPDTNQDSEGENF